VPAVLIALLLVHIDVPAPGVLAAFGLSFLLGYFVGFFINFILNCVAFWTLEVSAVQLILTWVTDLFGRRHHPADLVSAGLAEVIFALPFAAMFSTPLLIYVGQIPRRAILPRSDCNRSGWSCWRRSPPSSGARGPPRRRARRIGRGLGCAQAARRGTSWCRMRMMLDVYAQYWRINLLTTSSTHDFFIWFGFTFVYHGTAIAALYIILQTFPSMNGWSFRDMAFLYGLWMLGHALNNTFFNSVAISPSISATAVRSLPGTPARRALSSDHFARQIFPTN